VKGGGLSAHAGRATQISLIISDTNRDEPYNVASGPTFTFPSESPDPWEIVNRYRLASSLPASVLRAVNHPQFDRSEMDQTVLRSHHILLDNNDALERAAEVARALGFRVEIARDVSEQPVEEGTDALVSRLFELQSRARARGGQRVCLISGGEFSCPVRGAGVGGRNAETILRCAIEVESHVARFPAEATHIVALSAGTDGIDGNSPAAGAWCDETTLARGRALSLDARNFLDTSDAHTFFAALGDTITTGATGTNVRDLRLLLAE